MNNIYLVGFMGTGKTTTGRFLARKQKQKFVDLDKLIEKKKKRSISDIFAQDGEPYFRKTEKEILREVSRQDNLIISCGGGIVIDESNIKIMKETGKVVCLTASPKVILGRVNKTKKRPLLDVPHPEEKIKLLLEQRAPYYAKADKTIVTSGISAQEVAGKIIAALTSK